MQTQPAGQESHGLSATFVCDPTHGLNAMRESNRVHITREQYSSCTVALHSHQHSGRHNVQCYR
jgi:hypothetical protein